MPFLPQKDKAVTALRLAERAITRVRSAAAEDADAGFSLLEVVVSFVVFAIVASGATYGIVNALATSHSSQQRIDAANVAQSFIASTMSNTSSVKPENGATFTACLTNATA